jgi:hypothetical protein
MKTWHWVALLAAAYVLFAYRGIPGWRRPRAGAATSAPGSDGAP